MRVSAPETITSGVFSRKMMVVEAADSGWVALVAITSELFSKKMMVVGGTCFGMRGARNQLILAIFQKKDGF